MCDSAGCTAMGQPCRTSFLGRETAFPEMRDFRSGHPRETVGLLELGPRAAAVQPELQYVHAQGAQTLRAPLLVLLQGRGAWADGSSRYPWERRNGSVGGTHPGKGGADEQSYREPPGFCTVGKDTGSASTRPWGSNLAPTVLAKEPWSPPTVTAFSQSLTASLFPGPLQTAAEERTLLTQCLIQTHIHPCPHRDNQGVTSPSNPGGKQIYKAKLWSEPRRPHSQLRHTAKLE